MKICERCGKELKPIDMYQTDANGQYFCCVCCDISLAEWVEMKSQNPHLIEEVDIQRASIQELSKQLVAMTEEKERCRKLAVDYALMADSYKASLERCENMKLAHEFEYLLRTTSIPVAVEKVKTAFVELAQYKKALELAVQNDSECPHPCKYDDMPCSKDTSLECPKCKCNYYLSKAGVSDAI